MPPGSWYEKAANAANTQAMFKLAFLLAYRLHPPELAAARGWWEKAADAGDISAMFYLAFLGNRLNPLNG